MTKHSQGNAMETKPPNPDIVAHNTAQLSMENVESILRRKSCRIKNQLMSRPLNVLANKNTGKIAKIASHLLDTDNPDLVNIYVTVKTRFDEEFKKTLSRTLELDSKNDLSDAANSVMLASLKQAAIIR